MHSSMRPVTSLAFAFGEALASLLVHIFVKLILSIFFMRQPTGSYYTCRVVDHVTRVVSNGARAQCFEFNVYLQIHPCTDYTDSDQVITRIRTK